ncbi:MAG: low molecular weight phosphotyrosine protein phosphatase [Chlorobiaceae bacterium]|nr:low molecular weight phosphotyrosine protein phosphatase [Chlorobiaceae bacterium]
MQVRLLFVCYENICRSPMAEGAFRYLSSLRCADSFFEVESAGTVSYQAGSCPDNRAVSAALEYGIDISAIRAQSIQDIDLEGFDRVFAMDIENYNDLLDALGNSAVRLHMMTDFAGLDPGLEVEDPYYGSEEGFKMTMKRLMHCAEGILSAMQEEYGMLQQGRDEADEGNTVQYSDYGDTR